MCVLSSLDRYKMPLNAKKILVHQDLVQINHFSYKTLVAEDTKKALKKNQFNRSPIQNIQWYWVFRFFHPSHDTWLRWKNLKSPFHWITWANILLRCSHIISTFCAVPRNWGPAFKLNTSKLVPLLPGTNVGTECAGDT